MARSNGRSYRMAEANLKLCFPAMAEVERARLIKQSIHHTVCALFELAWAWYRPMKKIMQRVRHEDIDPDFLNNRSGRIIIAPHHGSWELLNLWLADQGPLISLYKPAEDDTVDRFICRSRSRNGAQLVPANTAGLRRLLRGLKSGTSCMILPDQRPGEKTAAVDAPFFGVTTPTSLLVSNICRKINCEVYIAAALRHLDSGDYGLKIKRLDHSRLVVDDLQSASYLNARIESFIRSALEQYQWTYRRFDWPTYLPLQHQQ